ncbi:MAG: VWA domain-containing protein [Acidobacteriia bacterium]|nr:VWA domain-containing protein [Terriglobia bacterium]MYG01322.1 VWA domain-containing protein [Terriglobia bacterium]MYK09875.1 VWA domain-containing protein [Terriglobia bacterium]
MLLRCSTLLAAVGLFAAAWAQESGTAEFEPVYAGQESDIIKIDVARVPLLFTVTDRRNRFITDLGREDFKVFDDGWEQEIREFDRESDLPLRIGVILDTSNSIRARFKFEQEAAIEFLQGVLAEEHDRAFLVSFDTRAELIVDYTNNIDDLADGVRRLRAGGGTALYDAIYYACRDKLPEDQPKEQFRRALVVIGDGEDNRSTVTREDALEMAHKAETVVYTISTNRTGTAESGDKTLRRFARETGGVAFHPFQARDLQQSFANIANELRHQYFILYSPSQFVNDGSFHTVEVRTRHRNATVRVRRGYYAPLPSESN